MVFFQSFPIKLKITASTSQPRPTVQVSRLDRFSQRTPRFRWKNLVRRACFEAGTFLEEPAFLLIRKFACHRRRISSCDSFAAAIVTTDCAPNETRNESPLISPISSWPGCSVVCHLNVLKGKTNCKILAFFIPD